MEGRRHISVEAVGINTDNDLVLVNIDIDIFKGEVLRERIGVSALIVSLIGDKLSDELAAPVEFGELFGYRGKVSHNSGLLLDIEADGLGIAPELIGQLESLLSLIVLDIAQILTFFAMA